jgi:hypothetical protein
MLAQAYLEDGKLHKAIKLLEHVVVVKAKVLRPDHPSRLLSDNELAATYEKLSLDVKS